MFANPHPAVTALSTEPARSRWANVCSPHRVRTSRTDLSLDWRNIPRSQSTNAHLAPGVSHGGLHDGQAVARLEVGAPQVHVHVLQGQLGLRQVQGTCHVWGHPCKDWSRCGCLSGEHRRRLPCPALPCPALPCQLHLVHLGAMVLPRRAGDTYACEN